MFRINLHNFKIHGGRELLRAWTVWGSNLGGNVIFCTCSDRRWGPPSLLYDGYRVALRGVKRLGSDFNHPPPSSAEVKEGVQPYLYSPSGISWPVTGHNLPLTSYLPRSTNNYLQHTF
jgi:hypothetical protein